MRGRDGGVRGGLCRGRSVVGAKGRRMGCDCGFDVHVDVGNGCVWSGVGSGGGRARLGLRVR